MADKIQLGSFNIDIDSLVADAATTKKAIEEIKNEQKELVKQGKQTDTAFIQNAIALRGLSKDYNAQLKVIDQVMAANGKAIPIQQRIDAALSKEATTVQGLRDQISELTKIRNEVNITTEEGQKQLAALNSQIDANNELIKENVSELDRQKMGIGGYADGIREALGETGLFDGKLNEMQNTLKSFTPIFTKVKDDVGSALTGLKNFTAGTEEMSAGQKAVAIATNLTSNSFKLLKVALIGTGIGAIVVLLGSLVAYLNSSEQASSRLGKILGTLGGIVSKLLDYLEPLGELIMDGIVVAFETMGKVATYSLGLVSKGLAALGFDNAAKSVSNFSNEMSNAAKNAGQLADMEAKLAEATRKQNIVQLQYQNEAEKLRQIRDNENLTIAERVKANEQLGDVLKRQLDAEKQLAAQALAVANLRIAQDGRTAANLDAQAAAMEKMIDIQERITGQESEQLTNRVSLQKEAADKAREAAEKRIEQMNQELELYKAQQSIRAQTLEQEIAQEEDFANRRKAILDQQRKNGLISQTQYNTEVLNMENDLNRKRAELAIQNAQRELEQSEARIEYERAISKAVGQIAIDEERNRAKAILEQRATFEYEKFLQGITNEQEYQDAISELTQAFRIKEAELDKQSADLLKKQKEEQAKLDFDAAMIALEERNANEFEIRQLQIEQQREQALEAARQQYTDSAMLAQAELNINQQAKNAELQLEKEKDEAIWQARADLFGAISGLIGEETALGKAAAIAQATINTYQGATKALASLPPPASYIAAATTIATGLKSVGKIVGIGVDSKSSTPEKSESSAGQISSIVLNAVPPFAKGGKVTGGLPIKRSNGDNVLATLRLGEVVLNERQQAALGGASVFRAIGVPGFANGGLVGSTATVQNSVFKRLDKTLVDTIGDAVRTGSRIGTEQGSRQGIGDVSTENYLRNLSAI